MSFEQLFSGFLVLLGVVVHGGVWLCSYGMNNLVWFDNVESESACGVLLVFSGLFFSCLCYCFFLLVLLF